MTAELVPMHSEPPAIKAWNREQLLILKRQIAKDCSDDELEFFAQSCKHQELDPFRGEIVAISRYSNKEQRNVMSIQITVEGLRTIAERSGLYAGQDAPQWCGPDGIWHDVWLDTTNPPAACKAAVHRRDFTAPVVAVVRYASFVQLTSKGDPTPLWKKMPDHMLAKAAEAAALKKAFPKELARAGVNVRDLTDAQRVVIEARAAGLDDEGRHELIAEITDGRTDSSRDLTDPERLATRKELAARTQPPAEEPWGDWFTDNGWSRGKPDEVAYKTEVRERLSAATPEQQAAFKAWREQNDVPALNQPHTAGHARLVASHLLDILGPPQLAEDVEEAELVTEPPATLISEIDRLYAKVEARVGALTAAERIVMLGELASTGIPGDKDIKDLPQDQVHVIDAYLDQLEEPF